MSSILQKHFKPQYIIEHGKLIPPLMLVVVIIRENLHIIGAHLHSCIPRVHGANVYVEVHW